MRQRERRALIAGSVVITAALVMTFIVLPAARSISELRQAVAVERSLLERERDVVVRAAAADSSLRAATRELAAFAYHTLDGAEPALAGRDLASFVEAVAVLTGVESLRSEPLGVERVHEGTSAIRVRVSGRAAYGALMLYVHRLEEAPLAMRVEQISITSADPAGAQHVTFSAIVRAPAMEDQKQLAALRSPGDASIAPAGHSSENDLLAVLGRDPFASATGAALDAPVVDEPTTAATLVLVGTVVLPGSGGVVMARAGTEPPRIVRIGESIGGMVLRRVEPGAAEFEDHVGMRVFVRVPKPGV